jgi:hypothetical protein
VTHPFGMGHKKTRRVLTAALALVLGLGLRPIKTGAAMMAALVWQQMARQ